MLFQHDPAEPIGVWTEITRGCARAVRARPAGQGVARAREVLSLMRGGALDGLSIGFRAVRAKDDPATGVRRILEADLWEISVVTFPMLPGARIDTVKGRRGGCRPSREFERWLTRDAGLTRGEARTVIAKGLRQPGARAGRRAGIRRRPGGRIRAATRMIKQEEEMTP